MSTRQFSKVSPTVWRSGRFARLSNTGKVLYLFYLACEHQNSAGCFRLPDGYACSDLHWQPEAYIKARSELTAAELITYDPDTSEIYVDRWFKHNPPMNEKHAQGTRRLISSIESDVIREKAEEEFEAADSARSQKVVQLGGSHLLNSRYIRGGGVA